jgi:hypothetical protein
MEFAVPFPQQRLYFRPEPQGQGALRGIFALTAWVAGAGLQNEALTRGCWASEGSLSG